MKTVRVTMMAFAFLILIGGYFRHQVLWLTSPEGSQNWNERILPALVPLGWFLLIAALVLGFLNREESSE